MMETLIKRTDPLAPDAGVIRQAAAFLRAGDLVAFPTETVYGLGADALRPEASAKIYAAKGRPSDNPLIVHIARVEDLYQLAKEVPAEAIRLAEAFWPGPLTMILKKKDCVPAQTTGGLDTVAIRFPSHPVARALIAESGVFVAAPSANTSGKPSPTQADHVARDLDGRIAMLIDGGDVGIGLESTIVDLSVDQPTILRPGYITEDMLLEALGSGAVIGGHQADHDGPDAAPKAPGMKYRHYAPKAPMLLVEGQADRVAEAICRGVTDHLAGGRVWGILCAREAEGFYRDRLDERIPIRVTGSRDQKEDIARNLYRVLREFDEIAVEGIYAEAFDCGGIGDAIRNRMEKAAGHRILRV